MQGTDNGGPALKQAESFNYNTGLNSECEVESMDYYFSLRMLFCSWAMHKITNTTAVNNYQNTNSCTEERNTSYFPGFQRAEPLSVYDEPIGLLEAQVTSEMASPALFGRKYYHFISDNYYYSCYDGEALDGNLGVWCKTQTRKNCGYSFNSSGL